MIEIPKQMSAGEFPFITSLEDGSRVIVQIMTDVQLTETFETISDAAKHGEGYGVDEFSSEEEFRSEIQDGHFYAVVDFETGDLMASLLITHSKYYRGNGYADPFLIVKNAYRGKGLGEMCMRLAIKFAKEVGYQGMYVDTFENNKPVIKILEKIGTFKRVACLPVGGRLSNGDVVGTVIYHMNWT